MKKHLLAASTILTAFLGLPFVALAAGVTVGNSAVDHANVDTYSDFTIIDTNVPVSANGWLSDFSYFARNKNSFEFVLVDGTNVVQWVSPKITPAATGVQTYAAVVPVQAGWNLGVHFDSTGTIPFDYVGAPASYTPNHNGPVSVGDHLTIQGTSNRVYGWGATGSLAESCSVTTLSSGTDTLFKGFTYTDPGSSLGTFEFGTPGSAVIADSIGFPGAWDTAAADPDVSGAAWVNDNSIPPTNPAGAGGDGTMDSWRLFTQAFSIPANATISSAALHFTADNSAQAFLDNSFVGSALSYTTVSDTTLNVSAGAHELEFVVKNDAYDGATNPTGLLYRADINYCVPNQAPECPAAPSVAAHLLKDHNIKSKAATNFVSLVAHEMGPQNLFEGVPACDISAYEDAVNAYLKSIPAYN